MSGVLGALALMATAACVAAPVQAGKVHAGPYTGTVIPRYDAVGGRFRLHVGPYRDQKLRLTQTIEWSVPRRYRVGSRLSIVAVRLSPPPRQVFAQWFASSGSTSRQHVFPSLLQPTSAGCWRLTLHTGTTSGSLKVLVRG